MDQVTFADMATKVERDLDLEDEVFITRPELMGYANEALHDAESTILRLCEDYFLDSETLTLVSGTADYSVPSNFYADKIRSIVYANGSMIYTIRRLRAQDSFERIAIEATVPNPFGSYTYLVRNTRASGRKITFYPTPRESGAFVTVWGIRSCTKIALDTDTVDIPEFHSYIEQFMKVRCYEKEGHPNLGVAVRMLEALKQSMIETLANRFPDNDDVIEPDMTHYLEHN
jgi:hypothetical protein